MVCHRTEEHTITKFAKCSVSFARCDAEWDSGNGRYARVWVLSFPLGAVDMLILCRVPIYTVMSFDEIMVMCVCVCLWVGCVIFRWPLSNNKPSLLEPFAKNINAPTSLQIGMPTHKLHVVVRSDTIKTNGGRAGTNCKCYLVAISSALSGWSGLRAVKVKIIRVIRKTSKLIAGLLKMAAIINIYIEYVDGRDYSGQWKRR